MPDRPPASGPLAGLRVVEMAGLGPGPFAAMLLADLGADVIRVERDGDAAGDRARDVVLRNRCAIRLDVKAPEGRDALLRLIDRADALVEGFRPGVMERLGLGPEPCLARNPRLVYGRVTGWGQEGPLASTAGHDINYIALAGVLSRIGRPGERPVPPLNLVGDYGGGALYLAFGLLSALWEARSSGRGQVVDAAMLDGAASLLARQYGWFAAGAVAAEAGVNLLDGGAYFYDTYVCADGRCVAVGAIEGKFHAALLSLLGIEPSALPRQDDPAGWTAAKAVLAARFLTRSRDEWAALAEGSDACVTPVLGLDEAPKHPHAVARATFVEIEGVPQPAPAPRFGRTPSARPQPGRLVALEAVLGRWDAVRP